MSHCEQHGEYEATCFRCTQRDAKPPKPYVPPTVEGWTRTVRNDGGDIDWYCKDFGSVGLRAEGFAYASGPMRPIPISILADLVHAWESRPK